MSTHVHTKEQYRVLCKFRWSSRFTVMKGYWSESAAIFDTEDAAHKYVQRCLDGSFNYRYRDWPFEGAEFRTEGRTVTTTTEISNWKPARKVHA